MDEAINFAYRPLSSDAVLRNWKFLSEGIKTVLTHTDGQSSIEETLENLCRGKTNLVAGFVNEIYAGFIIVRVDPGFYNCDRHLTVLELYVKPEYDGDIFLDRMYILEEMAKKSNCNKIRFWSPHRAWEKKLKKHGWQTRAIEYTYTIKKDGA
jgi:hypothetical protein